MHLLLSVLLALSFIFDFTGFFFGLTLGPGAGAAVVLKWNIFD